MKRPYTKQLYELIYKRTRIKPDPQVFLGMVARAQTVDTRPFFCERPGYEARVLDALRLLVMQSERYKITLMTVFLIFRWSLTKAIS